MIDGSNEGAKYIKTGSIVMGLAVHRTCLRSTPGQEPPWQTARLETKSLDAFVDMLAVVRLRFLHGDAGQGHAVVGFADPLPVLCARLQLDQGSSALPMQTLGRFYTFAFCYIGNNAEFVVLYFSIGQLLGVRAFGGRQTLTAADAYHSSVDVRLTRSC